MIVHEHDPNHSKLDSWNDTVSVVFPITAILLTAFSVIFCIGIKIYFFKTFVLIILFCLSDERQYSIQNAIFAQK